MFKFVPVKVVRFVLAMALFVLLSGKPASAPGYVDCIAVDAGNCPTSIKV